MPDDLFEQQKERKQRILAIDDDPEVLELITATLEDAGYEVMTSETAEMALNLMNDEGLPHLAVIDIRLPVWTACPCVGEFTTSATFR